MTVKDVGAGRLVAGRYRLRAQLGAGGMGTVWRAYDEVLRVDVAVKEIRFLADLDGDERAGQVDAAMREARNAARLRGNPHVVTVHDAVEQDGLPWIVMDHVPADTLAATVEREGPLPVARVGEIGLAVLDALTAGRRLGVLHRDVKPSNILLAHDGRVLLTDFGIATHMSDPTLPERRVGGAPLVHAAVDLLASRGGTPAYMAPERLLGGAATLSGDLFALGAVLYFGVEGASPFTRDSLALTIGAVVHEEPPPMSRAGPLAPVIAGLLAKSPATRLNADGAAALLRWALTPAGQRPRASAGPRVSAAPRLPPQVPPPAGTFPRPRVPARPPVDVGEVRAEDANAAGFGDAEFMPGDRSARRSVTVLGAVVAVVVVAVVVAAVAVVGRQLGESGGRRAGPAPTASSGGAGVVPGSGGASLPAGMVGRWWGTVAQGSLSFPLELTLRAGRVGETVGSGRNPNDGCTSDLLLRSAQGGTAQFTERLTAGTPPCVANGVDVLALRQDGTLDFDYPASPQSTAGHGTLRRLAG
ncbi:serine/threonine-protein kinase [Frankia sp. AgB32]|uniref:serine/threonine-protein kinase n=1 Tax=Frankia sp. AgB32 TaxID=631119 RepID=UPI00200F7535|nr:serine/threonine-protein kinase [Frankia sp. AgB32]MCK9895366.1 serine/threonine protein kinase [Frankia sp. AgB32]